MRIGILAYCSRSGSTYLGNALARSSSQLVVVPESNIVHGLVRALRRRGRISRQRLARRIMSDPQLQAHGLPAEAVRRSIDLVVDEGDLHEALRTIGRAYADLFGAAVPDAVIFKKGTLYRERAVIEAQVPRIFWIVPIRDPRAVAHSILNTSAVYGSGPMAAGDLWYIFREWSRVARFADGDSDGEIYAVKYEDMIVGGEVVPDLLRAIGVTLDGQGGELMIPEQERGIHSLVRESGDASRIARWRSGDRASELEHLAVRLAGAEMMRLGYSPTPDIEKHGRWERAAIVAAAMLDHVRSRLALAHRRATPHKDGMRRAS